jgi:dTDP-4-dehydrorhamnose reductase
MKILVTGSTGLIGSRFKDLLGSAYEIEELSTSNGINILDKNEVSEKISSTDAELVLHFAAKANVDLSEEDKEKDKKILSLESEEEKEKMWLEEKTAWGVNVFGTQNIVQACEKNEKKIIYLSTDFVFDGQKRHYDEEDEPSPVNWYGTTKYEGEKVVKSSQIPWLIVRIAYPYRSFFERKDFVRVVLDRLYKREDLKMVTDHIMVPTFIDDLVNAIDVLIQREEKGIFHAVGSESITPYDAALKIAHEFDLDNSRIEKTTRQEYFKGKAQRPFCLNLKNDKIGKLGVEMSSFEKGLKEIKEQLSRLNL